MYLGYHERSLLPIKNGQMVRVPAGTEVRSMHPKRKRYTLGRAQWVKVDHLLSGSSQLVWRSYVDPTSGVETFRLQMHPHELDALCAKAGKKSVEEIKAQCIKVQYRSGEVEHFYPLENPQVRWAGSGGYWNEVDINAIV